MHTSVKTHTLDAGFSGYRCLEHSPVFILAFCYPVCTTLVLYYQQVTN
jgi:hypothetical protein